MQIYLIRKKCSKAKLLFQMAVILHKSTYVDHEGTLLRIFFKIICYFLYRLQGRFINLKILGSGEAEYDFEVVFCNFVLNLYSIIEDENAKSNLLAIIVDAMSVGFSSD